MRTSLPFSQQPFLTLRVQTPAQAHPCASSFFSAFLDFLHPAALEPQTRAVVGPEDRGGGGDYPAARGGLSKARAPTEPQGASTWGWGQEGRAGVTQDGGPACGETWTDRQRGLPSCQAVGAPP